MKKNLLFILVITFCTSVMLQAQNPVPNPGFENWTTGNPDDWTTNNLGPGSSPVMQTTPPNSGNLAVKGEVIAVGPVSFFPLLSSTDASAMGFPVSQQYAALSFYYKTNMTGTSTFNAFVGIQDAAGNTIGAGAMFYTGVTSTYTFASIPIFYTFGTPDEGVIAFTIGDTMGVPAVGNYFIVDDVSLSGTVGIEEEFPAALAIEKLQPNPVTEVSSVYYSLTSGGDITFELFDVTGRKYMEMLLKNETAGRHKIELDVSEIPAGFYVLQMTAGDGKRKASLQVVH